MWEIAMGAALHVGWIASGAVAGILGVGPTLFVGALAAPPPSCYQQVAYNVEGFDDDPYYDTMRGVRVTNHTGHTYYCQRIASIAVFGPQHSSSDHQLVEWGWYLGYGCDNDFQTYPTGFFVWNVIGGGLHCVELTALQEDSPYRMRLSDQNGKGAALLKGRA
jgi:hypothetical protein